MSDFIALNAMQRSSNGVYTLPRETPVFGYSDGEDTEQALDQILSNAKDLSSSSSELEAAVTDWPTEYHLSSTRANLLRALDLTHCTTVLELGCGCGSISRYLGEQEHLQVDAVEGSPVRAALAAKRCADLSNVRLATANFNDLEFPKAHYDLVLFVGVLEYAGRFSERDSDQEAALDLLALAKRCLKPNGIAIVAIENRTGLKYLYGANEDHYAVPYVGVENYPDSTGIRTYDLDQWHSLLAKSNFDSHKVLLPFPDYKIPTLIISDDESADKSELKQSLKAIISRDYCAPIGANVLGDNESQLWRGVVEASCLTRLSNSYLWVLGSSTSQVNKVLPKKATTSFKAPVFKYLTPASAQSTNASTTDTHTRIERLHAHINSQQEQIDSLQQHAEALADRVKAMSASKGWRLLSAIRRLVGRG